ncbi:hypothetical protein [Pseudomonas sp. D2002]|uniref:hypothetical protein n=1 Tax=Pseudomonas sp. D2002 TaxID=2726980 RepID=UPI0015A3E0C2|nr:hypothetical protein [Pseudomonas sp. D2002]NWA83226.1 hypothetical protein [Pseudomonas sp. D2002]
MKLHPTSKASSDFRLCREFDCWRGLDFDEKYKCAIEVLPSARIMIELDIVSCSVTLDVAQEIAECLKEALAISVDDDGYQVEVKKRPNGLFKIRSLAGMRGMQYAAFGEIDVEDASGDFFEDSSSGTTSIVVATIQDGGHELIFPFMGYSFTKADAAWLSEALFKACGERKNREGRARDVTVEPSL